MAITIKFIGALRHLAQKSQLELSYQPLSIKDLVADISQQFPALAHTFRDETLNDSKSNSLILINGREISVLNGYKTKLNDGDEIVFVPVVHGG